MKESISQWFMRMRRPRMARRLTALLVAVCAMGLGVAVFDSIGFGTDPCSTMNLGLSRTLGVPFGTMQLLINLFMLAAVIRYDVDRIGIGSIANMVLVGYAAQFFMAVLAAFPPLSALAMPVRLLVFALTLVIFLIAASTYMVVDMGVAPYDAIPQIIAKRGGWPFRVVRMLWDTFMMAGGYLLGSTVGLVTVGTALCLGPMVAVVAKKVERFFC